MPCSCIVDKPTYPQNEEWGPLIWLILHTFAEKAGQQTNAITMGDEMRAWPLFVSSLSLMLPCPYCKDHFQQYLKDTPFQLPSDYMLWKTYIPEYFYQFHEDVNRRIGKPSFPQEELKKYKDISMIKNTLPQLEIIVKRAIQMGGVSLFYWKAWLKHMAMLRAAIA